MNKKIGIAIIIVLIIAVIIGGITVSFVIQQNKINEAVLKRKNASTNESSLNTNSISTSNNSSNNTQRTITMEIFNKISDNMTYKQVCDIIGFEGTLSSQYGTTQYGITKIYTWEKSGKIISIAFVDNKVVSKTQTGL